MELNVDLRQPVPTSVASLALRRSGSLGSTAATRPVGAEITRPYSFWADCECPDDCLRDHENE